MTEVGDGNLNLVFMVEGPAGDLCVKQALPYALVGDSWPLDLKQAWFEHRASIQSRAGATAHPRAAALRRAALPDRDGALHPCHHAARHDPGRDLPGLCRADYGIPCGDPLFYLGSGHAGGRERALVAAFSGNTDLCRITEDLIFTDPYMVCSRNRWTSPQLDDVAAEIRGDAALKRAVSALKLKFLCEAQACCMAISIPARSW